MTKSNSIVTLIKDFKKYVSLVPVIIHVLLKSFQNNEVIEIIFEKNLSQIIVLLLNHGNC